jgi:hypothetical protein
MGDAVAHLSGADHPDTLNLQRHDLSRSMRSPGSWLRLRLLLFHFYAEPRGDTTGAKTK